MIFSKFLCLSASIFTCVFIWKKMLIYTKERNLHTKVFVKATKHFFSIMNTIYLDLICKCQCSIKKSFRKLIDILHFPVGFVTIIVCIFHSEKVLIMDTQLLSKLQYKYHIIIKFVILTVNYLTPDHFSLLNHHYKKHASKV